MDDFILRLATGLPGFLVAIVFHEFSHAYVAYKFGDDTAERAGRLTINPMAHIDMLGTVVFPLIGAMIGGIMFGWAKPVPVDARRFRKVSHGIFWVSFAGPLANIFLGILSAFLRALVIHYVSPSFYLYSPFIQILEMSVFINFILALFNLIPLPPLDGSKMVSVFLDYSSMRKYEEIARFSFPIFIVLLITGAISYMLYPAFLFGKWITDFFYMLLM